jgi:hypothetical protein
MPSQWNMAMTVVDLIVAPLSPWSTGHLLLSTIATTAASEAQATKIFGMNRPLDDLSAIDIEVLDQVQVKPLPHHLCGQHSCSGL